MYALMCSLSSVPPLVGPTIDLSGFKNGLEVIVPNALIIRVPITGYPVPKPKWTFGDKELTAGDRVSMVTKPTYTELAVAPSVRPDKGTYTLQLENDVTSVSGEIEVNVIGMQYRPTLLFYYCLCTIINVQSHFCIFQHAQVHPKTSKLQR